MRVGRWTLAMALGVSAGYLDLLEALISHSNTQGDMRNFGMPLALDSLVVTGASWLLLVFMGLVSSRLQIRSARPAAIALIVALTVEGRSLHVAADRLAALRLLLPSVTLLIVGLLVYQGMARLEDLRMPFVAVVPCLLGITVALSLCAHRRVIGPMAFAVLLPIAPLAGAAIVLRRGTSPWFIALPWLATLLAPGLDWTAPGPRVRQWIADSTLKRRAGCERPDVLLVTVDALRADVLPLYGSQGASTPVLDRMAADSYVFEQACSPAPWTLPAMATLFTGADPAIHGVARQLTPIPSSLATLAEDSSEAAITRLPSGPAMISCRSQNVISGAASIRLSLSVRHSPPPCGPLASFDVCFLSPMLGS